MNIKKVLYKFINMTIIGFKDRIVNVVPPKRKRREKEAVTR